MKRIANPCIPESTTSQMDPPTIPDAPLNTVLPANWDIRPKSLLPEVVLTQPRNHPTGNIEVEQTHQDDLSSQKAVAADVVEELMVNRHKKKAKHTLTKPLAQNVSPDPTTPSSGKLMSTQTIIRRMTEAGYVPSYACTPCTEQSNHSYIRLSRTSSMGQTILKARRKYFKDLRKRERQQAKAIPQCSTPSMTKQNASSEPKSSTLKQAETRHRRKSTPKRRPTNKAVETINILERDTYQDIDLNNSGSEGTIVDTAESEEFQTSNENPPVKKTLTKRTKKKNNGKPQLRVFVKHKTAIPNTAPTIKYASMALFEAYNDQFEKPNRVDFICAECGLEFTGRKSYTYHAEWHHLPRKVKCVSKDCERTFVKKSVMERHAKGSHYKCKYTRCRQGFLNKEDLNVHFDTHTKPYFEI